jgi:hypothetical protein
VYRKFSKSKIKNAIPIPKLLITATASTQQPSHQEYRGKAMKERGSEEGERRGKRWGSCVGNRAHTV